MIHATLPDCLAADFARRCKHLSGIASDPASLESKPFATRNRMKKKRRENIRFGRGPCGSHEFREFREFRNQL